MKIKRNGFLNYRKKTNIYLLDLLATLIKYRIVNRTLALSSTHRQTQRGHLAIRRYIISP